MPALMHAGANLAASERSEKTFSRSPIACTFSVDLDANVTPASYAALARPQHLSHPVVLLPVQASPAAVAVAAHRSTTTPRSSWVVGTVISTMLAFGLLQSAEGERLQVRVADG
jgi:hypothetical protein